MKETDNLKTITENRAEEPEPLVPVEQATLTPEQVDDLRQKAAKADENWDRLVRTAADFDNYRKRAMREKQEAIRFANEAILEKLMPVLDNFDMAVTAAQNSEPGTAESFQAGVNMILQQLKRVLTDAGLQEIDARGKPFDPNLHEAIAQQPSDTIPEGYVLQQVRKGYRLHERLLRPASVVVASKPA